MIDAIKEYSPEQKIQTTLNKIHKYYDNTSASDLSQYAGSLGKILGGGYFLMHPAEYHIN